MSGEVIKIIALVSAEIGSLATDKRNKDQNYDYISADNVLSSANPPMAKHGLVILPSISEIVQEVGLTGGGKTRYDTTVNFVMTILGGGESLTAAWSGKGSDYSTPDKAFYKAVTSGHKYFLMKLFNIGVGNEDGEHEPEGESVTRKQSTTTTTTKKPPQYNNPSATPPAEPAPVIMTVRDLILELSKQLGTLDGVTDDSLLKAINETPKGKAYMEAKTKPLGFGTELSPSTYEAIKGQVLKVLNPKASE